MSIVTICPAQFDALIAASSAPDYTTLLTDILAEVTATNANTDQVEVLLTNAIASIDAGNVTLTTITTLLGDVITGLQSVDDNTDQLETLIQTEITTLQTESDQTQVLLQTLIDKPDIFKIDGCLPCPADPNEPANAHKYVAVDALGVETALAAYYADGTVGVLADFGDCCECA